MLTQKAIEQAIRTHGARKVYAVSIEAFGNRAALRQVGLDAANMADVNRVSAEAYKQLGAADQAIDQAQASAKLAGLS